MYQAGGKRLLDIFASFFAFILLSPLFLLLCLLIKTTSRGRVFFKQRRLGMHKSEFYIYKFRTMRSDTPKDVPTHLLNNPAAFITPVGRFLRKTSLDELPQLLNILQGHMSLVGPRPALWNQEDLIFARDQCGANSVRPGLTGLAQVMGRDELPIGIKAAYDAEYVKKISFLSDLRIIFQTAAYVVRGKGVSEGAPPPSACGVEDQSRETCSYRGEE